MLWAIQNVDIFGGEGLREALGKLMVVGQRLPAEAEKNGKDLRTRLTKFLGATYTAVEKADKASSVAERLARLAEVGVKLLDKIN